MRPILALGLVALLAACTSPLTNNNIRGTATTIDDEPKKLVLKPGYFGDIPYWKNDNLKDFAQAYNRSCEKILAKNSQANFGPDSRFGKNQEWQILCRKFAKLNQTQAQTIRSFFENNFVPYAAFADDERQGLFTGYYEAALNGSKTRQGKYQYPLRARPDDLVMVNLGEFREELKGKRIAGRVNGGRLKPYEDHAEILAGDLPDDQDIPLVWVDSPIDSFFIQIQGSGVVSLDDGSIMRVGYAGQNGHPYYAVGRELVKNGELRKDEVSLQTIRAWMEHNPSKAIDLMTKNKSYVFFREVEGEGPIGAQNLALTAKRSLAIDHSLFPYGMPIWLEATHPDSSQGPIRRLMMAQDTGGAIRGPVRGDFFWGYGAQAEKYAGEMKSEGRYWILMPRNI